MSRNYAESPWRGVAGRPGAWAVGALRVHPERMVAQGPGFARNELPWDIGDDLTSSKVRPAVCGALSWLSSRADCPPTLRAEAEMKVPRGRLGPVLGGM